MASLNLAHENNAEYSVTILNKGDSNSLSSLGTTSLTFSVLESPNSLGVEDGYVTFTPTEGVNGYLITFEVTNYIYEYTLVKSGNTFVVSKLDKISKTIGASISYSVDNETDIFVKNGKVYFWPTNYKESSTAVLKINSIGESLGEKLFISSQKAEYSTSQVGKFNISALTIKNFYNNRLELNWVNFKDTYNVTVQIINEETGAIITLTGNTLSFEFDKLQTGVYTVKVQVNPHNYTRLKSDFKIVTEHKYIA